MNQYKLVTIDLAFYAQLHLRLGNEQLLRKAGRGYVGLYDEKENWYIPIRSNLGKKKPSNACFPTPFQTSNPHFKNPGLDFQKAIYVPKEYTKEEIEDALLKASPPIEVVAERIYEAPKEVSISKY